MELSTKGRYAVMAMVQLAGRQAGSPPMNLAEIAACQCLSQCYLEQLFGKLRRAGLVCSARGPGGGYRLARPAGEVTIAEIMLAVDEKLRVTRCEPGSGGCLDGPDGATPCQTHDLWDELGRHIRRFLDRVTLEDVARKRALGDDTRKRALGDDTRKRALGDDTRKRALGDDTRKRALGDDTRKRALGDDTRKRVQELA